MKTGRPNQNLGPAFTCRLKADQDAYLRKDAAKRNVDFSEVVREWVGKALRGKPLPKARPSIRRQKRKKRSA